MISYQLMAYCFIAAGIYLLAISLLIEWIGKRLNVTRGIENKLLEPGGAGWFLINFLMEFLFFAAIPTMSYSFFYLVFPLSGLRAALAIAVLAFTFGAVPIVMGISVRLKLPMVFLLYNLLGYLLKLSGAVILITYIYNL
ncbi:MAG: hypothetical protein ABIJ12_14790 [bacterium]